MSADEHPVGHSPAEPAAPIPSEPSTAAAPSAPPAPIGGEPTTGTSAVLPEPAAMEPSREATNAAPDVAEAVAALAAESASGAPQGAPDADSALPAADEPPADTVEGDARVGAPAIAGARGDLSAADVCALLRATFADGRAHHWTSHLDALGPITAGLPAEVADWTEGRVWGAQAEVRWQADGAERFSALYLADGDTLPDGFQPLADGLRAVSAAEAEGLFLWGARTAGGQYREPRLPHPLDYAALNTQRAEVRVPCRLLIGADGQVRWVRLAAPEDEA